MTIHDATHLTILAEQESNRKIHSLLSLLPHGVQECDLEGKITFGNKALHQIYGYRPGTLQGRYCWELMPSLEEKTKTREYLASLIVDQPPPTIFHAVNKRKDGALIHVEVTWNYRRDNQGKLLGFIAVVTDVTARVKAERETRDTLTYLENRVKDRTAELHKTVESLQHEITKHEATLQQLQEREEMLRLQRAQLEESNITLKVLLRQRDHDKTAFFEDIAEKIDSRLKPHLERLKKSPLRPSQASLVQLLEESLENLFIESKSPKKQLMATLSPTETTVAQLIKKGKKTREIATILGISPWTVETHREKIRKKTGIKNTGKSLKKTLCSIL